ncbi:hypothetical protein DPMN_191654 [Dreissena polymorpha]|uniref:Reverse transcriptase n=1 Tax=Dreissena polymorpha TaxID=45954 RepID=A0A9D3Y2L4_DREPO|nr:hypothetical protein DPMN_191654 [Dreissena polymorpha]
MGFTGKLLRTLKASYDNIQCKIRVRGSTSEPIKVVRSVRQGGVLSTFFYLAYIYDLLRELQASACGATVLGIDAGNPAFADDVTLVALNPLLL